MVEDIVQAVLSSKEIQRYPHQQIYSYLEELSTNQWYPGYRALKHPLYPILRKIRRHAEYVELAQQATQTNHVIYVSNHKSHVDYLVELLVLDEHGILRYWQVGYQTLDDIVALIRSLDRPQSTNAHLQELVTR